MMAPFSCILCIAIINALITFDSLPLDFNTHIVDVVNFLDHCTANEVDESTDVTNAQALSKHLDRIKREVLSLHTSSDKLINKTSYSSYYVCFTGKGTVTLWKQKQQS